MIRRLLSLVPPGTVAVGAGLALLGLASYVHLAVAGHSLTEADYNSLSVLWSIVFTLGIGLFMPVEQEVARLVAARHSQGLSPGPVLARGAALAAGLLAAVVALIIAARGPLADRLFDGDGTMVAVLIGALAGLAIAHTTRGILSGLQLFPWYGTQLGIDGGLRIALVAVLGLNGVTNPVWYGAVLVVAPVAGAILTAPPVLRAIGGGAPVAWATLLRGLGLLTVSSLLSQVVVNIGVINVKVLDPSDAATAGALLSALVLVRIPLFVFASLQASLLPGLATTASTGDLAGFHNLLRRALGIVSALGLTGAVLAVLLGPWLVQALFDAPGLGHADFAWLAVATLAYLWAMVLGQALLALDRHRAQALAWAIGVAALVVATLAPVSTALRVELGYAIGSVVVAVVMAVLLRTRTARSTPTHAPPLEAVTPGVTGVS
ncbi:lipopolysaccharide biosynthesis protein [Micromonospora parathelypteridis]|uniref:O-antigen/teichoic acid export membrane protein n=1 Tax=Micromonospora parathelypteridis TaxID=1839617 RepID=A0A840VXW0_9ACTN|nr:polysaccharide biosynthesis protein [Micromonospora parathelypteridis]MBB5481477.1 O-antigen/teichoic acid export membrane protein [Micromonospora parathelypteridis]GGO18314.1 membrane protein [Micromonospora parathelypteridis]